MEYVSVKNIPKAYNRIINGHTQHIFRKKAILHGTLSIKSASLYIFDKHDFCKNLTYRNHIVSDLVNLVAGKRENFRDDTFINKIILKHILHTSHHMSCCSILHEHCGIVTNTLP